MLSGFNPAALTAYSIKDYIMATKAKTKAGRAAGRNSSRSQSSNRNIQGASPSALEDHVPGDGVRAAVFSRSPAGFAGVVRLPWRAA
jgi:hypothetical protein